MRWIALLVLCACNQILGVHGTRHSDASIPFFDGQPDAPFACPMLGGAPKFQRGLYQAFQQSCQSYSVSSKGADDHALGLCPSPNGTVVSYGPNDSELQPQTLTPAVPTTSYWAYARLVPDDDQMIVAYFDAIAQPVATRLLLYAKVSDGNWQELGEIGSVQGNGFTPTALVSMPTRGTQRHAIVLDYTLQQLDELVEGDGTTYPWSMTVLQHFQTGPLLPQNVLSLTPDGLHLVFHALAGASSGIYYADRAALLQPFGAPMWLMDMPETDNTDPFLTDNCARLYLSGLGSIFYAVQ